MLTLGVFLGGWVGLQILGDVHYPTKGQGFKTICVQNKTSKAGMGNGGPGLQLPKFFPHCWLC